MLWKCQDDPFVFQRLETTKAFVDFLQFKTCWHMCVGGCIFDIDGKRRGCF